MLLFADFDQPLLNGAGETWDDHFKFRNVAQRNKVHELRLDQMIQTAALLDHCTLVRFCKSRLESTDEKLGQCDLQDATRL